MSRIAKQTELLKIAFHVNLGSKSATAIFLLIYAWVEPGPVDVVVFHFLSVSVQFAPKRFHIFRFTCLVFQYLSTIETNIDLFSYD